MINILVDTDVLIDFTKGKNNQLKKLLEKQDDREIQLFVNPVIIAEFFTDRNLIDPKKLKKAYDFFQFFETAEITKKIGIAAGELLCKKKVNFLGDALIAATCLVNKLQLITSNIKHFKQVKDLEIVD